MAIPSGRPDEQRATCGTRVRFRRYAANKARLDCGDPAGIAGVVRELPAIESGRGLSAAERRMLARARRMLGQGS
jgi:RNA polymerase-interacting CarD/CdnL/TRCF family regulator